MHWSYLTTGGSTPRCSTSVSRKPFFYPFENFGTRNVHCFTQQHISPSMALQPQEYIILWTWTIYQPQMVRFCYSNDRLFHPSAVCKGFQVSNFTISSILQSCFQHQLFSSNKLHHIHFLNVVFLSSAFVNNHAMTIDSRRFFCLSHPTSIYALAE